MKIGKTVICKKSVIVYILVAILALLSGMLMILNGSGKPCKFDEMDYSKYAVRIVIKDGTSVTNGCGAIISSDDMYIYICTNAHILNRETTGKVILSDGEEHDYNKVFVDEENDVALASIPKGEISEEIINYIGDGLRPLPEDAYEKKISDSTRLYMITGEGEIMDGENLGLVTVDEWDKPILETTIKIQPGTSGSPIFNEDGYLVGIAMAKLRIPGYDERYFAVPSSYITKCVTNYCNNFNFK